MKHIRLYENDLTDDKKYLLVKIMDVSTLKFGDDYYILYIFENIPTIHFKLQKIYHLNMKDNILIKIKNPTIHKLSIDDFIGNTNIIKKSDNLDELIKHLEIIRDLNK